MFRRRGVPMDDVVRLMDGLRAGRPRRALADEVDAADAALDEATSVYRWYRRLSGDARTKNKLVDALYKGI